MVTIDDIIKRSSYMNHSNLNEEYARYHNKTKLLLESNRFSDKKFILQHWESLNENQTECFKIVVDMLEEAYENDNINDFNYIKSYIINEVTPTVRDAKQTSRYLKYKTTRMKNKITEKLKKNVEAIKDANKQIIDKTKETNSQAISSLKTNVKKSIGKEEMHEAYIEILDTLEKYNHCDRILENANTIQKRFNIMHMIEDTDISNDYKLSVLIDSICECVNTYDIEFGTRFNSVLETCFYFLGRTRRSFNKNLVLEQIVDNFLSKDLPKDDLTSMRSIIESAVVIDTLTKKNVEFIYNTMPYESVSELAEPFNGDIKNTLESISENMTDSDVRKVLSIISSTDLQDVNFNTVNSLISKVCSLYTGNDFNKLCCCELNKIRESGNEEYIKILNKYASKTNMSESEFVMDFDMYNEAFEKSSNTVKDIINSFKLAKMKRQSDPRTCVSKMFTKSPNQIIEGTPNLLSWIRLYYIIGATAIHPVLGAITLLTDQFIALHLKRRDVSKMITVFKNERKAVAEKMNKVDEKDKANLKEYDRYLKDGIEKLKEYEESLLTDNEIYSRDTGEEYDKDEELSFIKDDDDDDDFSLESTSFEKLIEKSDFFSKKYFTDNIKEYISEMSEDTIDTITNVACKYPNIISTNRLYTILKEELDETRNTYSDTKNWVRISCLTSNADKVRPENAIVTSDDACDVFEVITGLDDLFIEYSINKTMGFTNESVSTNIKMLSNKLQKMMQKASDMDKEASRKIDSSVNMFISGMQRAARNNNREAIIRGSILPSASKVVKAAILDTGVALVNPALAIILAVGQFAVSKKMKVKERQLVLDEIDIELEMCKRYLRQAEDQNDLEAQKKILRIQRNLERQKQRIQYNMKIHWNQDVPNTIRDDD